MLRTQTKNYEGFRILLSSPLVTPFSWAVATHIGHKHPPTDGFGCDTGGKGQSAELSNSGAVISQLSGDPHIGSHCNSNRPYIYNYICEVATKGDMKAETATKTRARTHLGIRLEPFI